MPLHGVIFDFNGTLFFDSDKHMKAFHRLCREYGVPDITDDFIVKNIFGRTNEAILKKVYNPDADKNDTEYFSDRKENYYREACLADTENFHLVDGAPEFLDCLAERGIPFAMATGSEANNVDFYFDYLGIGKWFSRDRVIYDDGTMRGKPYPDIYIRAAHAIGLEPGDCIVFEDATSGIRAANAASAGAVMAIVTPDYPSPLDGSVRVDGTVGNFTDYENILKRFGM